MRGNRPVGGKQRQPGLALAVHIERLNTAHPFFLLAVVDLAQIQHVSIDDPSTRTAAFLRDAPVPMLLAVFEPSMTLQVHAAQRLRQTKGV